MKYVCYSNMHSLAQNKTFSLKFEKVLQIKCPKPNLKIVFILFKIISELENIKQVDVKDEAEEKYLKTESQDLKEAPQYETARIEQEINPETLADMPTKDSETILLEEAAAAKGKPNPFKT